VSNYELTIVEPSAIALLEDMEKKNLIRLSPIDSKERFRSLLAKLRRSPDVPTLEEITAEVERVRAQRHHLNEN
jgi:hypothetical protein